MLGHQRHGADIIGSDSWKQEPLQFNQYVSEDQHTSEGHRGCYGRVLGTVASLHVKANVSVSVSFSVEQ